MKKDVDAQIPNYSNLPPKLICLLHGVTLLVMSFINLIYLGGLPAMIELLS